MPLLWYSLTEPPMVCVFATISLVSVAAWASASLAPKLLRLTQGPPRLAKFVAASGARIPSRGNAGGVGELRVRAEIQRFDQPEGDCRVILLAEQILERLGFVDIALGGRMRVKEAPEELDRIAHMFGCDAERVSLPKTLASEPFSAPQEPAVKPIEALDCKVDDGFGKPVGPVALGVAAPAAQPNELIKAQRKARDRSVIGEPRNRSMRSLRFRLRHSDEYVESRRISEARQRSIADGLNENVPVARLTKKGPDPFRLRPERVEFR